MRRRSGSLRVTITVAALGAVAVIVWRTAARRTAALPAPSRHVLHATRRATASGLLPIAPEPLPEDSRRAPSGHTLVADAEEDRRRLRIAYVLTALCAVGIVLAGLATWLIDPKAPAPRAVPLSTAPSAPARSAAASPTVVPNTSGPGCPTADPCRIRIHAINVDTTVAAKPTVQQWDPFIGKTVDSFGVPDDFTTTTWWSSGPRPGQAGMAVILGHHYSAGYGVFNNLGTLRNGDLIEIHAGSTVLDYQVDLVDGYLPKTVANALSDALSAQSASQGLAVISCTGDADPSTRQIVANVVVFARLVAHAKVSG